MTIAEDGRPKDLSADRQSERSVADIQKANGACKLRGMWAIESIEEIFWSFSKKLASQFLLCPAEVICLSNDNLLQIFIDSLW